MISITKYKAGTCDGCNQRPAEYSIKAERHEWSHPMRPCQPCMLGIVESNASIRAVLLLLERHSRVTLTICTFKV